MKVKRTLFAWHDAKRNEFRISYQPPDAPTRPSVAVRTKAEVDAMAENKRAVVHWWPPLPDAMLTSHGIAI